VAPHAVREKLVLASEAAILCPSHASQLSISAYLEQCDWKGQIQAYRGMYAERCEAMMGALAEHLPQCTWTKPAGGFYTWVTVPQGIDTKAMLPRATTGLVAYVSGTAFYSDGQGGRQMRLSFCYPSPDRIREGVRRLSGVLNQELELVRVFGGQQTHGQTNVQSPSPDIA
jgi:DNA-binding transcriptional MocR family regulator